MQDLASQLNNILNSMLVNPIATIFILIAIALMYVIISEASKSFGRSVMNRYSSNGKIFLLIIIGLGFIFLNLDLAKFFNVAQFDIVIVGFIFLFIALILSKTKGNNGK